MTPAHSDFYEQGIDLFNEGRFFECHEAWEEIWKRSDGELKLFYQGLIQAAVAILHAQRGNLEGARSLYEKASAKLDKIPHEHMGLAVGELRIELRRFHRNRNPRRRRLAPCSTAIAAHREMSGLNLMKTLRLTRRGRNCLSRGWRHCRRAQTGRGRPTIFMSSDG